jgi:tetratricopeptide (TPR) repeat protein
MDVGDMALSAQLSYTARMERAYLLMFTGDPQDLAEARKTYESIIGERPADGSANFRLGQVLRRQGESGRSIESLEGAIDRLQEAARIIEGRGDWRLSPDEGWVYDAARLNLGVAHFQ